jgi:hypothetical protein
MLKVSLHLIVSLVVLSAVSCKKTTGPTGPAGPTGSAGPSFKGAINGHVRLYDQYGSRLFSGYNNVTLTLKGGKVITPDSTGFFTFDSVTTGTYTIQASCTGFGATMLDNFQFVNDTLYRDIWMSAIPAFRLSSFSASHNPGSVNDSLVMTFPQDTRFRRCIVFVGHKPSVSNMPGDYINNYMIVLNANQTTASMLVPVSDLNAAGFFYGEAVYYAVYSYVMLDGSVYEDMVTGNNVYNAVSNPIVDSAMCP